MHQQLFSWLLSILPSKLKSFYACFQFTLQNHMDQRKIQVSPYTSVMNSLGSLFVQMLLMTYPGQIVEIAQMLIKRKTYELYHSFQTKTINIHFIYKFVQILNIQFMDLLAEACSPLRYTQSIFMTC